MPVTYNGIGTRYYGRRNVQTRPAACPHCGRQVELQSYDTRLWFVIFFIPIIPLERKRIIDYCRACTRHYAADADKWETAKQLEVSGAMDQFRSDPTPEAAVAAHQQLINFHEIEEAAAFREKMRAQFADHAKVHAYLGVVLSKLGQFDEAARDFARALALRPDLPDARVGLAEQHMRGGQWDEARALLDFLEKPGAEQLYPLAPLETLAYGFQKAGRHAEALDLFGKLIAAFPSVAQHRGFRKSVQQSEKALAKTETLLPKKKFNWREFLGTQRRLAPVSGPTFSRRGLIVLGALVGLLLIALAIGNEHVRRNRKLFIVSGFKEPVPVDIRGVGRVMARAGYVEVPIREGSYHASVNGPVKQEIDFVIRSGYFARWFDRPVWVLNAGNSALLAHETAVYSRSPRPASLQFYYGAPFWSFPKVTHPFVPLPESVSMKEHEERVLTHLDLLRDNVMAILSYYLKQHQNQEAMRLAEWQLALHPEDSEMLRAFTGIFRQSNELARVQRFVRAGLTNRPVRIEWHRAWQDSLARRSNLLAEYDQLVSAEPTNSALLYLRGRIARERADAESWYQKALAANPTNGYAHFALGYQHAAAADWTGARPFLQRATALMPEEWDMVSSYLETRMALGEWAPVEQELQARLARNPLDYPAAQKLIEVLVASGKRAEAERVLTEFERQARARYRNAGPNFSAGLRGFFLYATKDFAALERHAQARGEEGRNDLLHALVEEGRMADAEKIFPPGQGSERDPFYCLTLNIGWLLAKEPARAKAWSDRAVEAFTRGDSDESFAASLLRRATPPSASEVSGFIMHPRAKSIVLAALALQHPKAGLSPAARQFNLGRDYPCHLVERAAAAAE